MRLKKVIIFSLILSFYFGLNISNIEAKKQERRIVIDAGHGGIDGGAENKNTNIIESHINLKIAKELEKKLLKDNYNVFMIRDGDYDMFGDEKKINKRKKQDLQIRVDKRNEFKPDIFVSIHINKFTDKIQKGAQVWYADNEESEIFAKALQSNLINDLDKNNKRNCKNAKESYRILKECNNIIGVIVECGFISNYEESLLLNTKEYQEKIAKSIKKTIDEYYTIKNETKKNNMQT